MMSPKVIGSEVMPALDAPLLVDNRVMASEAETAAVAAAIAPLAVAGDVFALWGGLGCGKTVFARGFVRAWMGVGEEVPSPTFTLVQTYDAPPPLQAPIYHFDLFRIRTADEAIELGIEDAFTAGVALIEWPARLDSWLPERRLDVILADGDRADARRLSMAGPPSWHRRLEEAGLV